VLALNDFVGTEESLINIDDFDFEYLSSIAALEVENTEEVNEYCIGFIHYTTERGVQWRQLQQ